MSKLNKHALADESRIIGITIQLSLVHAEQLRRPINGQGGWQSFLKKLQNRISDDNMITLSNTEFQKIMRYTYKYGNGGFEQRLEGIIKSIRDAVEVNKK